MFIPSLIQTEKGLSGNDVPKKAIKQGLPRSRIFSMRTSGALFLFIQFVVLADDLGFTYPAKSTAEE